MQLILHKIKTNTIMEERKQEQLLYSFTFPPAPVGIYWFSRFFTDD